MKSPLSKAIAAFSFLALAACSEQATTPAGPPGFDPNKAIDVGIVTLKSQSLPRFIELPGRVVALATAEIRPQVDGIIQKREFREGGPVDQGDILYTLNDQKFQAAYAAAAATLKKAEASVSGAQSTLSRNEELAKSKAVSAQVVDDARTTLLQAQADVQSAQAALQTAEINRANATIRAPISGIISKSAVSVGSLVTANQTSALATIRQIDPVLIDLVDSSANLLRIREQIKSGTLGRSGNTPPTVSLTLENGATYDKEGTLSLADVVVSETTGTFSVRAEIANPDRFLLPGMFVRASVKIGEMTGAFLVPQRAVTRNEKGEATAYFVSKDGKVESRILVTNGSLVNDWIVTKGAVDGDRLIVDGLQKIRDGVTVNPIAVKIDADGVVEQKIAAPAAVSSEGQK